MYTEQEIELIKAFMAETKKKEAIKKAMFNKLGSSEWLLGINQDLPNEEFGERVKVKSCAILLLKEAFKEMELMALSPVEGKQHKPRI